jgi:hypothetical protein
MRPGRARWVDASLLVAVIAAAAFLPGMSVPIIIAGAVIGWILLGVAPPTAATVPPADEIVVDGRED